MSCVFCGMPPRDGEPCCTTAYRKDAMRRADMKIKAQGAVIERRDVELAALRSRLAAADGLLGEISGNIAIDASTGDPITPLLTPIPDILNGNPRPRYWERLQARIRAHLDAQEKHDGR